MVVHESPYGGIETSTTPFHVDLLQKVDEAIRRNPNKKAFVNGADPSEFLTYSAIRSQSAAVAQFLHNRGFVRQTACSVLSNCKEYFSFFLGVAIQGGAISGASALFTPAELERQFKDSRCTAVLTDEAHLDRVRAAVKEASNVKTIIVISAVSHAGTFSWRDVTATPVQRDRPPVTVNVNDDVVLLPYSSGTTGTPKGVMLTHANFGTMMRIFIKVRTAVEDPTKDWDKENILTFLPFYHIYGMALICYSILRMATTVLMKSFDPAVFLQCIQDYRISHIMIVPPIIVFLSKSPICAKYDLSSLKIVGSGAAPAGKDICDELMKRYPSIEVVEQGYGMTEVSMASHMPDIGSRRKFGSVGKLVAGMRMKIVDVATGRELEAGEAGEICVSGPTVMKGYLGRDEATRDCLRDGWMHTGDVGYCDADGDLYIVDRLKELIKVKGLQVPPAELEDILLSHPQVQDAAVIAVPDKNAGELPKAYVVRSTPTLTADEVYNYVKGKVSPYKNLNGGVEFIDVIPKSPTGKILRKDLRDRQKARL